MASGKRCHYEVMGLPRDCSADEIRSAYRKLALQRHPDKLVQSGVSQAEATAQFQELQHAYEVLSDPKERAWYDSHRSQILFSDPSSVNSGSNSFIPNLFPFFSNTVYAGYADVGKGFYKVYSDIFDKIYGNEINFAKKLGLGLDSVREAPVMGNLESPYSQVTAFYNYWLGFCTVMDFCWVDQYDVMAGPNRKSRRVMEEENKKLRKKAKREYNETVRGLAEFVKKRDKRIIDMAMKRNQEMEKKRKEEKERKARLERERRERFMSYQEPEWAKVEEEEEEEDNGFEEDKKYDAKEFYCVVCSKKFKSEKQWKNHEQSKKHKEKVVEFRKSLDTDEEELGVLSDEDEGVEADEKDLTIGTGLDDLGERFREGFGIGEEESEDQAELDNGDQFHYGHDSRNMEKRAEGAELDANADDDIGNNDDNNDGDDLGVLEAMLTGRKNRKKADLMHQPKASLGKTVDENDDDEASFVAYNNRKPTRRNRRAKKERSNGNGEDNDTYKSNPQNGEGNEDDDDSQMEEPSSNSFANNESNNGGDDELVRKKKTPSKSSDKRGTLNAKTTSKGKKSKVGGTFAHF